MSYIDQNLTVGEVVHYRTRLHWTTLLAPLVVGTVFAIGAIVLFVVGFRAVEPGGFVIGGLVCALIAGAALVTGWVRRSSTEMAVTNRRVLMKSGVFARRTVELMLSKVESISVDQGVMARMTGYGRVVVRGTGGTHEIFDRVAAPLEFRRQVHEQINRLQMPPAL
ncbi:MAG TPA: PH domain-containing protein [Candidatus Eisenbacteria bacterium]|nr:PH domain-containing protein [Candidatus Eisenbacteria bacterium]